jgi:hypothetical protein
VKGTCGITVVDAESFAVLEFIDLDYLGAEIYDLLPLDDISPALARQRQGAPDMLPSRTPAYAIDEILDGSPRPLGALLSATVYVPSPSPAHQAQMAAMDHSSGNDSTVAPPAHQDRTPDSASVVAAASDQAIHDALAARVAELEGQVRELTSRAATLAENAAAGWARAHELDRSCAEAWAHAHLLDRERLEALARLHALDRELTASWAYARTLEERPPVASDARLSAPTDGNEAFAVWDAEVPLPSDERFDDAYAAARRAGHPLEYFRGRTDERSAAWRTQVICWAAQHAARIGGSFVECRSDVGFYAIAVCQYVNFNALDRDYYLFDTTTGAPPGAADYPACCLLLEQSLTAFPRTHLVRGLVPDTLTGVEIDRVSFLSLDIDVAAPEIGVLDHFWPHLTAGAVVVLEGYGWARYAWQKELADRSARERGVSILLLPTGQGLLIKPYPVSASHIAEA